MYLFDEMIKSILVYVLIIFIIGIGRHKRYSKMANQNIIISVCSQIIYVQIAGMINQWKELINPVDAKKKKKIVSFQFAPGSFVPLMYLTGYLPSINLNRNAHTLNCKKHRRGDRLSNPRCSC